MQARFIDQALAAAKISPDAFSAIFKNKDADANAKQLEHGNFLIHELIENIPDENLQAILTILVNNHVNLESKNSHGMTPLTLAAHQHKTNAINFLLEEKVEVNTTRPALVEVINDRVDESISLDIVKTLVDHGANINIQNEHGQTVLMRAAAANKPQTMKYLISLNANLSVTDSDQKTVLSIAFDTLMSAGKTYLSASEGRYDDYVQWTFQNLTQAKNSFFLIEDTAKNHLYHQGALFPGNSEQLKTYLSKIIDDLVGHNEASEALKIALYEDVLNPILSRIKSEREQVYAFHMGSRLSARQQKSGQPTPPIYRFFQQDLVPKIFSYVHEVPCPAGVKKTKV